ncbi:MAG TPA: NUDIX domain-containing protein [Rhabdochlamydiaceae bacterium]|nr:NUDIX domain-containing protein [Rhabdochlamydiaceae bacterium]
MIEDTFHLGVKALIQNHDNQLLVLRKKPKRPQDANRVMWDLPGGRIHRGESLEMALEREVFEETGLKNLSNKSFLTMALTPSRIPLVPHDVGLILAVYLCPLKGDLDVQLSEEHLEFCWVLPEKAAELLKPDFPSELIEKVHRPTVDIA